MDEKQGIRKMLINEDGLIQNFPGFVEEDCWVKALSSQTVGSRIHFRTSFEPRVGRWIMLWQIQPTAGTGRMRTASAGRATRRLRFTPT